MSRRKKWVLSSGVELPTPEVPIYVRQATIESGALTLLSLPGWSPPGEVAHRALITYRAAWKNAVALLEDARTLRYAGRFARAFALAATSLEEIGKSQYAADVHTGFVPYVDFESAIRDHRFKSAYQSRAVEFGPEIVPMIMDATMGPALFDRRNEALYASPAGEVVDADFDHDASEMTRYCEAWLLKIHRQESIAERIGTRAFLK